MKYITLIDKAFLLKRTAPFCALDLDILLSIADKLLHIQFDADDSIFEQGQEAHRMFFIIKGQISLYTRDDEIYSLGGGDYFGEESLFSNKLRGYTAKATSNAELLTLSRTNLFTIISECPSVAIGFLQSFSSMLDLRPRKQMESEE